MRFLHDWFRRRGLVRPRRGRLVAGVCAGLARALGVNVWLVRSLAVLSVLIPGTQVLVYVVLWIVLPQE